MAWVVQLDWNNDVRLTLYQQPRLALNFSSNHISHQLLSADLWIESYCGIIMSVSWYYESHKIHIFTKFWMNSFKLLQLEYKSSSLYHIIIKGFIFIFLLKAHHQQDHFQSWKVEGDCYLIFPILCALSLSVYISSWSMKNLVHTQKTKVVFYSINIFGKSLLPLLPLSLFLLCM